MKIKTKRKNTTATTQYVSIDKIYKSRILDDMTKWIIDWHENFNQPGNPYGNIIFNPDSKMPKLGTGNDRSKGTGYNSICTYIEGIVDNHRFTPNPVTGKFTTDFTEENIKWISVVSAIMRAIEPDTYTEFEFVDELKWVNPADGLFRSR
jgi:hypothetical protein